MKPNILLSAVLLLAATVAQAAAPDTHRVRAHSAVQPAMTMSRTTKAPSAIKQPTHKSANHIPAALPAARRQAVGRNFSTSYVQRASSYSMPAYGVVIYSDSWEEDGLDHSGLYEIPTFGTPTSFHCLKENYNLAGAAGAVYAGDVFFSAVPEMYQGAVVDMTYYLFDTETWQVKSEMEGDAGFFAMSLTYDPTSQYVYGCFINSESGNEHYYFGSLDVTTGSVEEIKNWGVERSFWGMAASPNGQLYGMSSDGWLCSIDKRNGAITQIASTGIMSDFITSATIDPKTGKMYYIATTYTGSELYEIDPASGSVSLVYAMPGNEEVVGLYIPQQNIADGAPGVASDITASFEGGSLSGTVNFTAPTLNYNNIPGSGNIAWTVMLNGTEAASGTTTYGARVSAEVTAPSAGTYTIAVAFRNEVGQGPLAVTHLYVGPDQPKNVTNVVLDYADGAFKLTWDAPAGVNGGFIDPSRVSYVITRYPDNVVVAPAHRGTTFTEQIAEPASRTKYYYTVAANYAGYTSDPVASNVYTLGSIVPPFSETFDTADALKEFTIVDANNDGTTWEWVNGEVKITYNSQQAANDFLVLPPVKLQGGKTYSFAFDVKAQWDGEVERVAAFVGQSPTAEGLSTCLLAPTSIPYDTYRTTETFFVPQTDGIYFFAVQGCSEANRFMLCVDNIYVSDGMNDAAPAAPTDFTVTPGESGQYTATLSLTAPDKTIAGKALAAIDHLEISRNGKVIATEAATPGQAFTYIDNSPETGNNDYCVAAYNEAGKGAEAHQIVYVGVHAPEAVTNLIAVRSPRHNGEVNLSWDPVTTDIEGNPLKTSQVKYVLYRWMGVGTVVAEGLTGTTYKDTPCADDDPQRFIYYAVSAYTEAGEGDQTVGDFVIVGKPYDLPYTESYSNSGQTHIFALDDENEYNPGEWIGCNDAMVEGIQSQDSDNGFISYYAQWPGAYSTLYSGNILIDNAVNPELSFYYFDYESDNEFDVLINAGSGFRNVRSVKLGAGEGWTKVSIPLAAYDGYEIRYAIAARVNSTALISFDNFRVGSRMAYNLVMKSFNLPESIGQESHIHIFAEILNDGTENFGPFDVELYRDGKLEKTLHCEGLEADQTTFAEFIEEYYPTWDDAVEYQAVIVAAADQNQADNSSAIKTVRVNHPTHPVPLGLKAVSDGQNVVLSWDEPDFDAIRRVNTLDGAEEYRTYAIGLSTSDLAGDKIGNWTMVDADGLYTYGIGVPGSNDIYQYANAAKPMAFQVFSPSDIQLTAPRWQPHTGSKMFVAFASEPNGSKGNDDWMISPALSQEAQTITFFAKSADTRYGKDEFEVLYSTQSTDISTFVKIGESVKTDEAWQQYSFDLPEGAKYFAIRNISYDTFALCIDDISFVAADAAEIEYSLVGYNVYRNQGHIARVEDQSFTDENVAPGTHTYHVSALYTIGESRVGEGTSVNHATGVNDALAGALKIIAGRQIITVAGAEGSAISIAAPDGRIVAGAAGAAHNVFNVAPGIYIVSVGQTTAKVLVR